MIDWQLLGIEPTNDTKAIKKAYAKKLRDHHPAEDPEGYQRLRETYDEAVKQAKRGEVSDGFQAVMEQAEYEEEDTEQIPQIEEIEASAAIEPEEELDPVEAFIQRAEQLYNDFFARMNIANWEELFQEDIIWEVQYSEQLEESFIYFLKYHPHLPEEVWKLINTTFDLTEEKERLKDEYGDYYIDELFEDLNGVTKMNLNCFTEDVHIDVEAYFDLRKDAQEALRSDDLDEAESLLDEAYAMYQEDSDLLRLRAICYRRQELYEEALQAVDEMLVIVPEDYDGLILKAQILYQLGNYEQVIEFCSNILEIYPKDVDVLYLITQSSLYYGNGQKAYDLLQEKNENRENRHECLPYLYSIVRKGKENGGPQFPIQKRSIGSFLYNVVLYYILLILARNWMYGFAYLAIRITPIPNEVALILCIPVGWELLKIIYLFLLQMKRNRR